MNGGEVAVVLAEGKVRVEEVEKAGNGTDMTPGRQLVITDRRWTMSNVDVKKETGWTEGRLIFMHDPLLKAHDEVNRYSTRKLTFNVLSEEHTSALQALMGKSSYVLHVTNIQH